MPTSFNSPWHVACFTSKLVIYRRETQRGEKKLDLICSVNTETGSFVICSTDCRDVNAFILPRFSIFFSATGRRIWVLSIGIWLCTHWFHTQKWKIMRSLDCEEQSGNATPRFGFCSGFASRHSFVTQNIDFLPLFFFQYFQMNKASWDCNQACTKQINLYWDKDGN